MNCYTYMVQCSDGTLYTGWTNDLKKRLEKHNAGKGARYTRGRLPVKLVYYEVFATKSEAMKRLRDERNYNIFKHEIDTTLC